MKWMRITAVVIGVLVILLGVSFILLGRPGFYGGDDDILFLGVVVVIAGIALLLPWGRILKL